MPVEFKPKAGKPHIYIHEFGSGKFALAVNTNFAEEAWDYVGRVNPTYYTAPGEAARALHYGSKV